MVINTRQSPWVTRDAPWIVALELLKTSLRLSWSPLGAPETSITPNSDAQSSFGQIFIRFWALHSSAQDLIFRAQNELWRGQNRRNIIGKSSGHQILRLWRSLGHREATRRTSRRSPRAPKSQSIQPAE